jgi:hypothetical protein
MGISLDIIVTGRYNMLPKLVKVFCVSSVVVLLLLSQTSCSKSTAGRSPPLDITTKLTNQTIALVPVRYPATVFFNGNPISKPSGGITSINRSLKDSLANPSCCGAEGAALAIAYYMVTIPLAITVNALDKVVSEPTKGNIKITLKKSIHIYSIQLSLAEKVAGESSSNYSNHLMYCPNFGADIKSDKPNYESYKSLHSDTGAEVVLETSVQGVQVDELDSGFLLNIVAEAKLFNVVKRKDTFEQTFTANIYLDKLEEGPIDDGIETVLNQIASDVAQTFFQR